MDALPSRKSINPAWYVPCTLDIVAKVFGGAGHDRGRPDGAHRAEIVVGSGQKPGRTYRGLSVEAVNRVLNLRQPVGLHRILPVDRVRLGASARVRIRDLPCERVVSVAIKGHGSSQADGAADRAGGLIEVYHQHLPDEIRAIERTVSTVVEVLRRQRRRASQAKYGDRQSRDCIPRSVHHHSGRCSKLSSFREVVEVWHRIRVYDD
jgi:hypothetical protein